MSGFCILVCGGRDFDDAGLVERTLNDFYERREGLRVVTGAATGADDLARSWALMRQVPYQGYPASWSIYGRRAGPIRNQYMLDVAKPDVVVAFAGGRGTHDMVTRAMRAGVPVIRPAA